MSGYFINLNTNAHNRSLDWMFWLSIFTIFFFADYGCRDNMNYSRNAVTHWVATNKEVHCSSGDIGFISRRGNDNKLSHFLSPFDGTCGQKCRAFYTGSWQRVNNHSHVTTLEICLFTTVDINIRKAPLILNNGKRFVQQRCCSTI